jgi:hypothetical protein
VITGAIVDRFMAGAAGVATSVAGGYNFFRYEYVWRFIGR